MKPISLNRLRVRYDPAEQRSPRLSVKPATRVFLRYAGAVAIVAVASVVADIFSRVTGTSRLTSIFLSSVLLAAFYLGIGPGYLAAALALVAHLYLVDPPYQFSLGSIDEMNALLLFLASSVLTCLLAGRVREERRATRERSRMSAILLDATREMSATADEAFIRQRLAERLHLLAGGPAFVREGLRHDAAPALDLRPEDLRAAAGAESAVRAGELGAQASEGWSFRGLVAGDQVFGIAGWRTNGGRSLAREEQAALELLTDTGAAAIARARLAAAKTEAETRVRTEDLRNALLSSISHDLRTPLAAIMGSASSLRRFDDEFDPATRRDLATTIEEEALRLDAFVSNLLQMSRLQSGAVRLKQMAFGVPEAVRTTVERRVRGRPPEIKLAMEAALPEALGDPALFEQALGNVVDNALRYAGSSGPIAIRVAHKGTNLCVAVEDHGPGVPSNDLERIFEKFFRAASSEKVAGTGLGLAISRGLMEGMGGTVAAHARKDGGLSVELTLPTAAP